MDPQILTGLCRLWGRRRMAVTSLLRGRFIRWWMLFICAGFFIGIVINPKPFEAALKAVRDDIIQNDANLQGFEGDNTRIVTKQPSRIKASELESQKQQEEARDKKGNKTELDVGASQESEAQSSSSEVRDVYLVKVHKAGSTTLQNILYRFGLSRRLTFALFRCGNGMPFPQKARLEYIVSR